MLSSREGVYGNNAVQFQSCDSSSYCTVLGENWCAHIVSCQLRDSCRYKIFAWSGAISSRDPRQLWHVYEPDIMSDSMVRWWCRQFTEGQTNVHNEDCSGRLTLVMPELMQSVWQAVWQNWCFIISELSGKFPRNLITAHILQLAGDNISADIFSYRVFHV